eukprot:12433262-Alexandrium_andersonii.AAC.1
MRRRASCARCFVPHTVRIADVFTCANLFTLLPRPTAPTKCGTASLSGTAAYEGSDTRASTVARI